MSAKVSGKVWDLELPHNQLLVLLSLADHADHDGNNVFPSLGLISWKTGYSEQQCRRVMRELESLAILIPVSRTPGRVTKYRIDLSRGTLKQPFTPRKKQPLTKSNPLHPGIPNPLHFDTPTPDTVSLEKIAEPSKNHHKEPSVSRKREKNPLYDAIYDIWHYTAGLNGVMAGLLSGHATQKGYAEYNLDTPVTADELRTWAGWYRTTVLNDNPDLSIVAEPLKVQSSITYWQGIGKPNAKGRTPEEEEFHQTLMAELAAYDPSDIIPPLMREHSHD